MSYQCWDVNPPCYDIIRCTSCNYCQASNGASCCITGLGTCKECQSFCEIGQEKATDHASNPLSGKCFARNEIIIKNFSKATMQQVFNFLKTVINKGSLVSTGDKKGGDFNSTPQSAQHLKAVDYNAIRAGLIKLGQTIPGTFSRDDIIKGSYFQAMNNALNNGKLHNQACNSCNVECDVQCNECQFLDDAPASQRCSAYYDKNDVTYDRACGQTRSTCKFCNAVQCTGCQKCNSGNSGS